MNDLISIEEMAIIDENSSYLGVSTLQLMENAGSGLARVIQSKAPAKAKSIIIFAGTGNNGGDAFVLARHLSNRYSDVKVVLLGEENKIRTYISKTNWKALQNMTLSIKTMIIRDSSELRSLEECNPDIVVDGLLGTGVYGSIREPIASAIRLINSLSGLKVAIDVPSGINPDTGQVADLAVKADLTVSFHKIKRGLVQASHHIGELISVKIGIPPEAEIIVGPGDLRSSQKKRPAESHKGDFGKILVIGGGGGEYYSGAPALAGLAALRTGADLVNIATPCSVASTIRAYSADLIVRDLPGDKLSKVALNVLEPLLKWASGIIIGPGLGLDPLTEETILVILEKIKVLRCPLVVDADAIKAMATDNRILSGTATVITPHFGEYKILTGTDLAQIKNTQERLQTVKESAKELGVTLLVKGKEDFISDGSFAKINRTGTPAMTVGGTGDILSGIVGCLISQGIPAFRAANAGAFINGLAGEYAAEKYYGPHIVATDLLESIPKAMNLP
ncbi:MAG: NAD(P)H-hydrate dehydratase [Promethearchaeota archaeon]|nr:MAG: NAD(P)H-hydrate dehydratase [Candidatus Lokiarchaeota archaeon]